MLNFPRLNVAQNWTHIHLDVNSTLERVQIEELVA